MLPKAKTVYFHVDVNSAFLSWTAIQHLANGETLDLRTVPAVVVSKIIGCSRAVTPSTITSYRARIGGAHA